MDLQLAKPAAEGEMLFRGQMLVVKENDLMVEQCLADLANYLVGEWPGEIDASDFGAKRARDPLSGNRVVIHRASSPTAAHGRPGNCGDIRTLAAWQLVDLFEHSRARRAAFSVACTT
jgi:hypothetical protein